MTELHRYNTASWIETVYEALYKVPEYALTPYQHDDLMTAMSWITEELGYKFDTDPDSPTNGELVRV